MDYQKERDILKEERDKGSFIFTPSPIMNMSDSFYMPVIEIVLLRDDEVYSAQGKYRIHFNGLMRLACAAAMEWSALDTRRTDGRTDRLYCSFQAVGGVRKADGKVYFHKAEKDIDLEIVEEELAAQYTATWEKIKNLSGKDEWKKGGHTSAETYIPAMVRRDLIQKKKNKLMVVESGAKARVIRSVLGLQGQYSDKKDVVGKRFVMVHFAPNPQHPDVKQAMTQALPGSMNIVYGSRVAQIPMTTPHDSGVIDIDPEPAKEKEPEVQKSIDRIEDFKALSVDDQIKWLKDNSEDVGYLWGDCIAELNGTPPEKAPQQWRDSYFNFFIKSIKMRQPKSQKPAEDDIPY